MDATFGGSFTIEVVYKLDRGSDPRCPHLERGALGGAGRLRHAGAGSAGPGGAGAAALLRRRHGRDGEWARRHALGGATIVYSPPPSPPPAPSPQAAGSKGDPHLSLGHGGKADFRGRNRTIFNFFSAPHVSMNVLTEDGTARIRGAVVNGSWATQAHVVASTFAGLLRYSYWAAKISAKTLIGWSNGTCGGRPFKLVGLALTPLRDGPKNRQECGEVVLQSNYSRAFSCRCPTGTSPSVQWQYRATTTRRIG